jgi:phosphatidylserine/phosphatidylglycerophosphate/cardiolipin synthase-like enzyme
MLIGCTEPQDQPPIDEAIPAEPLFILLDAYRGDDQYFLRYRRGKDIFYAAGDLKRPLTRARSLEKRYEVPTVTPLDLKAKDAWERLTRTLTAVPIMTVDEWGTLREQLFSEILGREKNQGVAVSFDRVDYFFFYDANGVFRARRLIDKPAWYSVSAHVDLTEHLESWQAPVNKFLLDAGIESQEVIFSTGGLEHGAVPFLYINTADKMVVLVQYEELPESIQPGIPGSHTLRSVWHFMESHSYTILMRPFSSVRSLLTVVTDTAVETGRSLATRTRFSTPIPELSTGATMDLVAWEEELSRRLGRPPSRGSLKFLAGGSAFFPRFVDAVTSAKESVNIRTYIFDDDDVALNLAELLKRRSREGLDVKVLIDGLGTITASGSDSQTEPESHLAPASIRNFLTRDSRVKVRIGKNPWMTGDHVKTMVIDSKLAYLGGMNIGREYRYDWHDVMIEITGPVVDEINEEFRKVWGNAGFLGDFSFLVNWPRQDNNQDLGGYPLRLIYTKPGRHEIYQLQRDAMRRARSYIYIENAYFTDDTLLQELILARRRGVDVRVIIPLETDRGVITRNLVLAANAMLANGIRVFIFPGFSHAKAAIFDGWTSVGSANLDRLSLHINKELNVATSDAGAAAELIAQVFEPDFEKSTELTEPIPERWTDYIIEMFGDYLF